MAEGDAERFRSVVDEYKKAPVVTRDRLYIDTMQQVFSNVSKVMVDSRSGSNLLYLPLDKLMQQAAGAATAAPTPAPMAAEAPAAAAADARSRDGGRSRDRDVR
jgi:membrane protease subunit HflK